MPLVTMLSLRAIGIPWSGPKSFFRQCGLGCLGGGASPGVIDGEVGVENRLGHRRSSPYCVEQVDGRNLTSTETRPAR